ncbi:ABC-three component system protein [Flavicella sediminum]|uniref:ABC-three component system protein n=1 Tax=Flavicella sediminum TaxID=2585141 RepID=UPI00111E5A93|nr:ABC-three component system protein [Flavicella sediminum]
MSDSAKGSVSGYLFQFERALLLLSNLNETTDYISIENVDDIASHNKDGTVLIADQAKHSIAESGTTFNDTSYSLWRTIQIWITKLESNIFDSNTEFICSTNKTIKTESLLHFICNNNYKDAKKRIIEIQNSQKEKLKTIQSKNNDGKYVKKILQLINFALTKESFLKQVLEKLKIEDNNNLKKIIFNKLLLNSTHLTNIQKNEVYDSMIGWLVNHSFHMWNNSNEAIFHKQKMDSKYQYCISKISTNITLFRKTDFFKIDQHQVKTKSDELFVKQIDIIDRRLDSKNRIIRRAIEDYIRYEIEHTYIINQVGEITKEDFNKYLKTCYREWQKYFDKKITLELEQYSSIEKNKIAIKIYDYVMNDLEVNFNEDYLISNKNEYIKNGSFLKLSNTPEIGWHPDWEIKFKKQ